MRNTISSSLRTVACASGMLLGTLTVSRADVTIEQKTNLDVASIIRMHGAITTFVTTDKKRESTESHCEGVMSIVCGNVQGGEIVRLDRGLTWRLQPKNKTYREELFATPEQMAEMRAKMQATLEKMRSCPVSQKQQPIDKSKCEMSPPKIAVHKTDDTLSIAGHDAQHTLATLTETCTNKETGDACDTVVAMDVWLTQDKLPGDRRAFELAYIKKLGIDDAQGAMRSEFARYLGPYQSQIKALTEKSSDLKGQPMRTSLRVLMGGQQCAAAAKAKSDGSAAANGSTDSSGNPMADMKNAGKAIGSALGGLFRKKKADEAPASVETADAPSAPAAPANDPYGQYTQMAAFTIETVSINTDSVPAERFDVPADWKKEEPAPSKKQDDEFSCPKSSS
ncbi:MAG: hypothetical protein M3N50_01800 [Pseudomonadota bacterium]|nr:hypothetical protein [Pseudomonadota bacterium]